MTSQQGSAGTSIMLASLCVDVIRDNPDLVAKLRELAAEKEVPFDVAQINEMTLDLANAAILMIGQEIMAGRGARGFGVHSFAMPIPRMEHGMQKSANAMAAGSFTTEYVHTSDERLADFSRWMAEEHPDAGSEGYINREILEGADQLLTVMAHAAGHMADAGVEADDDDEGEPDGNHTRFNPARDDGTRHV